MAKYLINLVVICLLFSHPAWGKVWPCCNTGAKVNSTPWLALKVVLSQKSHANNNNSQRLLISTSKPLDKNTTFGDDEDIISGLRACSKTGSTSAAFLLANVECWGKVRPTLDIKWVKEDQEHWTKAIHPLNEGWNPWKSGYGLSCFLRKDHKSSPPSQLQVTCGEDPGPGLIIEAHNPCNALKLRISWTSKGQQIRGIYMGRECGKQKRSIQVSEESVNNTQTIVWTHCGGNPNIFQEETTQLCAVGEGKQRWAMGVGASIVVIVIMTIMTAINVMTFAVKWKLQQGLLVPRESNSRVSVQQRRVEFLI